MKRFFPFLYAFFLLSILLPLSLPAEESPGSLQGDVLERTIEQPIPGILVLLPGTGFTAVSDEKGAFLIADVPAGNYNLKFSGEGYKTWIETDVIVRSRRITYVHVKLDEQMPEIHERVEVTGSYFHQDEKNPLGVVNLSAEEVRRAPGTAGGVTRMLKVLPGTATTANEDTDLAIRGGSPNENGYIVDNIEFPYIDHLPNIGSSGGSYSALNADLIQNVEFYSGGFSSNYHGYLSAITDITLREGNRSEFDGQMNVDTLSAGFTLEGPIAKGRGAWLASFRKFYLKFLQKAGILDLSALIGSLDGQFKMNFDISPTQKLSLLYFHLSGDLKEEGSRNVWIQDKLDYEHHTLGINWTANWSPRLFSNTSLAFSSIRNLNGEVKSIFDGTQGDPVGSQPIWDVDDVADRVSLRNANYLILNDRSKLEFGLQITHDSDKLEEILYPGLDANGSATAKRENHYAFSTAYYGLFISHIGNFFKRLTMTIGLRGDYASANDAFHLSPRFSMKYQLNRALSLAAGGGVFYQSLPTNFLAYIPGATGLKDMKANHYSLGMEWFAGSGLKVTLEGYIKDYENLPISPENSQWLAIDWAVGRFRDNQFAPVGYRVPKTLTAGGSGNAQGIELFVQKKLVHRFYGFLSASYFRSRYNDLQGEVHDRVYDNRFILSLSGGYKLNRHWEFSGKFTLLGGGPYTPIDVEATRQAGTVILDSSRFLRKRYPAFNTLDIRVDRRFYFGKSSLTVYLDLWNVRNKRNTLFYSWSFWANEIVPEEEMGMLPVLGVEFEF
jgi:hypothetical protein